MSQNPPEGMSQISPYLYYRDILAAVAWLEAAFGFEKILEEHTERGTIHAEMRLGSGVIMMGQGGKEFEEAAAGGRVGQSMGTFVWVDDVDAHYARARAHGAEITYELTDQAYGRNYGARDPEGHDWFFTTAP